MTSNGRAGLKPGYAWLQWGPWQVSDNTLEQGQDVDRGWFRSFRRSDKSLVLSKCLLNKQLNAEVSGRGLPHIPDPISCAPPSHGWGQRPLIWGSLAGCAYSLRTHFTCSFLPLAVELLYIQDFTMGAQQVFDEPHQELLRRTSPRPAHQWPKTQGQSAQEWHLCTEVHLEVPNALCPAGCSGKLRAGICGGEFVAGGESAQVIPHNSLETRVSVTLSY